MRNILKTTNNPESGIVLVVCIILLLMLSLIGISSLMTSNTEMDISKNSQNSVSAFYLADAGVERALSIITDSTEWRAGFNDEQLGNGAYTVIVFDSLTYPYLGNSIMVRSTGKAGEAESTIEAIFGPKYRTPFQYGAYGRNSFDMLGGGMVDSYDSDLGSYASQAINGPDANGYMYANNNGNIRSEGEVKLGGNAQCHGDATTDMAGVFTLGGGVGMYGDTLRTTEPFDTDSIAASEIAFAQANNAAGTNMTLTGSATYNAVTNALTTGASGDSVILNTGTYYFTSVDFMVGGNLVLAPGANVAIYVTGLWDTSGGSIINSDEIAGNLHIYSTGANFNFSGHSQLSAAIYAPNSDVSITAGSSFFGSIIARRFANGGGTILHFDEALLRLTDDHYMAGFVLRGWTEL